MEELFELIVHTDDALRDIVSGNVNRAYLVLFLIIFCETGFILFPFLPGDGLLFSAGVVAASAGMDVFLLVILLIAAAITGNVCNFYTGKFLGQQLEDSPNRLVQQYLVRHITSTRKMYARYGGKSIVIGRFFPVVRTYIPFLAGVARYPFPLFLFFTVAGSLIWVPCFTLTGYFVGEIPWVQQNYGLIFLGLIVITALPLLFSLLRRALKG